MSNLRKVEIFDGTNTADVIATNGSYGLVVSQPNHISVVNSTASVLTGGATFTGVSEDITNYAVMFVNVYSDVASAIDGLCVATSTDNVNWDLGDCYTISANTYKTFSIQCATKYFKIIYENGVSAQTEFRLSIKLNTSNALDSSHRIADAISDQDDATLTKSVLTAQQPDTTFINIGATENGNLKVTDAESPLAIAKGEVIGSSDINKWGNAPDFATANGEINIWDGAEDGEIWEQMTYVFPISDNVDSISSTDIGDTEIVNVEGLDISGNLVTVTGTLNGQNRVALSGNLFRVHRAYNGNGTLFAGHIMIYENTALTLGVPTDTTKIKAIIHPENQQTEMAIFTIPAGQTGYLLGGYASTAGASKTSNYIVKFKTKLENKVFRLQQKVSVSDSGSSYVPFVYPVPQTLPALTDIIVTVEMTAVGGSGASFSAGFSIILVDN